MIPPIIPFVGKSGSGKTTFLEKLVAALVDRGRRVGVVKHDVHGFELDQPGKDTYRLRQAGAVRVAISAPRQFALLGEVEEELELPDLAARYLADVDIVLAEGYKRSPLKKVEVCRAARSRELLCAPEELLAVVSDLPLQLPCPVFGLDDVAGVAGLLEELLAGPAPSPAAGVSLRVDGREVPLKPFIQEVLAGAVRGMLTGLRDADGQEVELRIR